VKYLLDAAAVWEIVGLQPDVGLADWLAGQAEDDLALSAVTLGELAARAACILDPAARARVAGWLQRELPARFGRRLLPVDAAVALRWGELRAELPPADAWIAATALVHDLAVVTPHGAGLLRCGVRVENPWLG
jgi:hypothetical protein